MQSLSMPVVPNVAPNKSGEKMSQSSVKLKQAVERIAQLETDIKFSLDSIRKFMMHLHERMGEIEILDHPEQAVKDIAEIRSELGKFIEIEPVEEKRIITLSQ